MAGRGATPNTAIVAATAVLTMQSLVVDCGLDEEACVAMLATIRGPLATPVKAITTIKSAEVEGISTRTKIQRVDPTTGQAAQEDLSILQVTAMRLFFEEAIRLLRPAVPSSVPSASSTAMVPAAAPATDHTPGQTLARHRSDRRKGLRSPHGSRTCGLPPPLRSSLRGR